ncbi:carboxypeptidase regulatory-like domain-containing protein [Fulvivirga ulvae]|uniref:TonB-dependent receptor n=1 Tax=Fulvivirga ulvae TaxID=2904245 RepID=UPI001F488BFF|nr:carboxypeptidase regulatory-like domain-containing protein [Fulvivirga ulvae]UII33800.1 carboxypeptidase regulatory-like domain-containing protein [Fulvivirga ulvae]
MIRKLLLSLLLLFTGVAFSHGQGVTTAAIRGEITDAAGQGLPGATVIALHEPTGTQYGTSTRADGKYNLANLRVGGPYTIKVTYIGYSGQELTDVQLLLGQVLELDFNLDEDIQTLGEVVITGDNETFNSDRTGASESFSNEEIRKLPTITRSASDIYRLTPSSDGNSFGGRNDQYNNFSLDGSIFNNPFGLDAATPGGQTDAQPISLDAIDQIQVAVAPYDVTQSGFTGASINAVTKSGTNKVSGTVFGFYRSDGLTGKKVEGEEIFVPDLTQIQTGFSIGGPIIKDKLFFFANMEIERREDLGSSFVAKNGPQDGANESRVEESDLMAVQNALRSIGYDPGPYQGYKHDTDNEKGIIKLDWNINNKHTLTATYNFLDATKQKPAHPSAIGRRGPDATTLQFRNSGYAINNKIHSGLLEFKSRFSNKTANKFQIGFTQFEDSRDPFSSPFPVLNINKDGIRYIVAGHEPFSINNRLDQKVLQITDNFDIYFGSHSVTIGGSFEKFSFDNSFNLGIYEPFNYPYPGGTFGPGFNSVQDFLDYVAADSLGFARNHAVNTFNTNNANDSWALAETNVGQFALYVQDRWDLSENFTLTYGLRMDLPLYFDTADKIQENIDRKGGTISEGGSYAPDVIYYDEDGQPVQFDHTNLPDQTPLISPRVGFNWDVKGDRSLQVRGGTGLFTGRFPFVWVGNQVANPDFFFYTMTEEDFKFPQVWRTSIGADKKFSGGWIVSADLSYTKDINAMMVRNYGLQLPSGTLNGVDNRVIYEAGDRAQGPFGGATNAYVFTNTDEGRSFNGTLEVKRNWSNGLYTSLAYNYLDAKDASSIEAEISGDAYDRNPGIGHVNRARLTPSLYGNKHRVVGNMNKTFKYANNWSTTISLFFEYAKGGRFSYTYSGDINNDGSGLNDLIYIPTDNEIDNMAFTGTAAEQTAQRAALKAYISQDDYLSDNRGSYAEKYDALSPWYSRWDFRFLQNYKFANNNSIEFSIDILNIGNFINSDWGVRQFPTNTQPIGVSVTNGDPVYSFDTDLTETFTPETGLLSRWQMQFGLRYSF